jgi:hypothetical protein
MTENSEQDRIAALKSLVDSAATELTSGGLELETATRLVDETRRKAEELIPEDMDKYDMIYGARFKRLIDQFILSREEIK